MFCILVLPEGDAVLDITGELCDRPICVHIVVVDVHGSDGLGGVDHVSIACA